MVWPVVGQLSISVCPPLAFYILDISSLTISQIELKFYVRHHGN